MFNICLVYTVIFMVSSFSLAWAAARRAIGTRYGEQLT